MGKSFLSLLAALLLTTSSVALACEPCALFNAAMLRGHSAGNFTFSISEQFTEFDRSEELEENSIRDGELVRSYSTTQFALGYDISESWGVQATLPFIVRHFDEIKRYRADTKEDAGIGDMYVTASYLPLNIKNVEWSLLGGVIGGLKLPTGDTGVLGDVSREEGPEERRLFKHHPVGSSTGGRALTFGSGSLDYLVGINVLGRYQKTLILADAQYTFRTEGDYDYEFADDLLWSIAAGYYIFLEDESTVAVTAAISGDHKEQDELAGADVPGSQFSNIYVGPQLLFTLNDRISGLAAVEFRTGGSDQGSFIVPDVRYNLSLSYLF
ncbi:MAG: hypothetical protein J5J00_16820 [Deltaproteobacteria bacterium]|nr:hypothetical protein [Deltaproteobacteria bacterium]